MGWVAAMWVAAGCGHGEAMVYAARAAGPTASAEPRQPDSVVLEPPPALPSAAGVASARGVVALREPLAADVVVDVVESFVDAWAHEALDTLVGMLAADAGPLEARGRGRAALVEGWRQRMHAHEYGRLVGVEVVRPDRIQRWSLEDFAPGDPSRPDVRPGELLVRAPVETTTIGGDKLFGDVLVMILRVDEGKYKIVAYGETD
jgi:hypothetical protein